MRHITFLITEVYFDSISPPLLVLYLVTFIDVFTGLPLKYFIAFIVYLELLRISNG